MSGKYWIVIAALLGGLSVAAGAIGAHALDGGLSGEPRRIFSIGQHYHAMHALALLGTGIILMQTEGRRKGFATWFLQIASVAFLAGIVCFSGGLYVQAANGLASNGGIVPLGGISFMAGWAALAIGVLGIGPGDVTSRGSR